MKKFFAWIFAFVFSASVGITDVAAVSHAVPSADASAVTSGAANSRDNSATQSRATARRDTVVKTAATTKNNNSATENSVTSRSVRTGSDTSHSGVTSRTTTSSRGTASRGAGDGATREKAATSTSTSTSTSASGRNSRAGAASSTGNASARRSGVSARPSTASVGGRATIAGTAVQTGTNVGRSARSATTSRTATNNASASRAANSRASRAATAQASRESIAEAKERLEQLADLNKSCQDQYNDCMDQFCAVIDSNQKRCSCSANLSKYTKVETAVKEANTQLNDVAQRIRYVGLSADEIRAIMSATEAEEAMSGTTDNTETRNMLEDIADMIKNPSTASSSSSTGIDGLGLLDWDLDFSDTSDLFSLDSLFNTSSSMSNLRGTELYNAAQKRCKTILNQCKEVGATHQQITANYDLAIDRDCIAYEQGLNKMNETLLSNVRSANLMLQKARLAVLQNKNQYDAKGCVAALDTCMKDDMVCGENYEKCLDPTKKYIDENGDVVIGQDITNIRVFMTNYDNFNINKEFLQKVAQKSLGIDVCKKTVDDGGDGDGNAGDGWCAVKYLLQKIGTGSRATDGLCRPVLDKCQRYTYDEKQYMPYNDIVVNYIQRAMVNIKAGQSKAIADYAANCMVDVATCFNQQISQVNSWTSSASVSSIRSVMRGACRNVALTCGYAVFDKCPNDNSGCPDTNSGEDGIIEAVATMFYQSMLCPANSTYSTTTKDQAQNKGGYVNDLCICNEGYEVWNSQCVMKCPSNSEDNRNSSGQCVCKSGYTMKNGYCTENPNGQGGGGNSYTFNGQTVSQCPANSSPNSNKECKCYDGYWINAGADACECGDFIFEGKCVEGKPDNTTCTGEPNNDVCTCDEGYKVNSSKDGCEAVSPAQSRPGVGDDDIEEQYMLGDVLVTECPANSTTDSVKKICTCRDGFTLNTSTLTCERDVVTVACTDSNHRNCRTSPDGVANPYTTSASRYVDNAADCQFLSGCILPDGSCTKTGKTACHMPSDAWFAIDADNTWRPEAGSFWGTVKDCEDVLPYQQYVAQFTNATYLGMISETDNEYFWVPAQCGIKFKDNGGIYVTKLERAHMLGGCKLTNDGIADCSNGLDWSYGTNQAESYYIGADLDKYGIPMDKRYTYDLNTEYSDGSQGYVHHVLNSYNGMPSIKPLIDEDLKNHENCTFKGVFSRKGMEGTKYYDENGNWITGVAVPDPSPLKSYQLHMYFDCTKYTFAGNPVAACPGNSSANDNNVCECISGFVINDTQTGCVEQQPSVQCDAGKYQFAGKCIDACPEYSTTDNDAMTCTCDAGLTPLAEDDLCVSPVVAAAPMANPKFTITTTATTDFLISIRAKGYFEVDWGDGKTSTMQKDTVDRKNFIHVYGDSDRKPRTVKVSGLATGYTNDFGVGVISFPYRHSAKIAKIEGSLGAIFPTLAGGVQPTFVSSFAGASNLESIPDNLFAGIDGAPVESMFEGTFNGCSNLTRIPENLFGNISGPAAKNMFASTFNDCKMLTGPSAKINGKPLYEIWPDATTDQVRFCYSNDTSLDDYSAIPEIWGGGGGTGGNSGTSPALNSYSGYVTDCANYLSTNDFVKFMNGVFPAGGYQYAQMISTNTQKTAEQKVYVPSQCAIKMKDKNSLYVAMTLKNALSTNQCPVGSDDIANCSNYDPTVDADSDDEMYFYVTAATNAVDPSLYLMIKNGNGPKFIVGDTETDVLYVARETSDPSSFPSLEPMLHLMKQRRGDDYKNCKFRGVYFGDVQYFDENGDFRYGKGLPLYNGREYKYRMDWDCTGTDDDGTDIDPTPLEEPKFFLTTTDNIEEFRMYISATGNFLVYWGDNYVSYCNLDCKHTYKTPGKYNIAIAGVATEYRKDSPVILFYDDKISQVSGHLGKLFPTLTSGGQPSFENLFYENYSLTAIPEDLFDGVHGQPVKYMFKNAFYYTGITSIPENLFKNIKGAPVEALFEDTFRSTKITQIPANLFSGIDTTKPLQKNTFHGTFANCKNLTGKPASINNQYLWDIWPNATTTQVGECYAYNTDWSQYLRVPAVWGGGDYDEAVDESDASLIENAPFKITTTADTTGEFSFAMIAQGDFTIYWGDGRKRVLHNTSDNERVEIKHLFLDKGAHTISITGRATGYEYKGPYTNTAIDFGYDENSAAKIAKIEGSLGAIFPTLAGGVQPGFAYAFYRCSNITEIPEELFAGVTGAPKEYMFYMTFEGCTKLQEIPDGLFSGISGTLANTAFVRTFSGCTSLTGPSAKINGTPLYEIWPDATSIQVGGCYKDAKKLTDWDSIPSTWKNY